MKTDEKRWDVNFESDDQILEFLGLEFVPELEEVSQSLYFPEPKKVLVNKKSMLNS